MLTRRMFMSSMAAIGTMPLLAACNRKDILLQALWAQWQADWRTMEAIARKRQWELTPLKIAPPAAHAALNAVERRHALTIPKQLRTVLTELSAHVAFGWQVPQHQQPMERVEHLYPTSGGIRDFVWSLDHVDAHAIGNFLGWKRDIAGRDLSEAKNAPEMWENQFPFARLPNGDMLTIDVSSSDPAQQPVRYFSHELEGLHAHAMAPNFLTFVTNYAALGCAGSTHDDWFRFIDKLDAEKRLAHLSWRGDGAKRWFAWRDTVDATRHPDDPPHVIVESTATDRALLDAARSNSLTGVNRALMAGAKPDCVPNRDWQMEATGWDQEFSTAISYATRHNNTAMIDRLLKAGATLNTRVLPLNAAVKESSLGMVRWLITNGARVNGWKDQRYWPLHDLVVTRGKIAAMTKDEYRTDIKNNGWPTEKAAIDDALARHIDGPTYIAMLDALLAAGAKPDAPWDNGITMLAWGGVETSKALLAHGADPNARDVHGRTPLHSANTAEKVRMLIAAGADINARATPPTGDVASPYTPLQSALSMSGIGSNGVVEALLELGADANSTDGDGRSTLSYCFQEDAFRLIMSKGLDPLGLEPGKQTLLHNLAARHWIPRQQFPREVAFFTFLLGLGLDINARDDLGRTLLHIAAARESYHENAPSYELLITIGADKSLKDNKGQRAFDLAAKSLTKVRAVLQ